MQIEKPAAGCVYEQKQKGWLEQGQAVFVDRLTAKEERF